MTLRVVGSGLGRTGTASLKLALEHLLGGTCYHMREVFGRPDDADVWRRAALGEQVDWVEFFDGFTAAVDWPVAGLWEQVAEAFPDAVILHSTRRDFETWYRSAMNTIFEPVDDPVPVFDDMWRAVSALTFDGSYLEREFARAGYERHNSHVLATAPADRLVEYQPGDGWEPICAALGLAVPDEPFPHTNTTEQFRARRQG